MGINNRKLGYLLGFALSAVAAFLTVWLVLALLQAQAVKCLMSLGCSEVDTSVAAPFVPLGVYLLAAIALAVGTRVFFKSNPAVAFLLNVSPLLVLVGLFFLWSWYISYSHEGKINRSYQDAIEDAPAIQLGQPFVKKVEKPNGGVILFIHVPFNVTKEVRAHSLNVLAELERRTSYSANPNCNSGYSVPTYGFHVVDREYEESPLPSYVSGIKVVSKQLQPGTQYYLLHEAHFPGTVCTLSDFRDFDPSKLKATLNIFRVREDLKKRGGALNGRSRSEAQTRLNPFTGMCARRALKGGRPAMSLSLALFEFKQKKILPLVLLLVASSHAAAQSFQPVNRDASPEARKLLSYLYAMRGKHTLAGQHNYNHELNKYIEVAESLTGKRPAVWGSDFILGGTKDYGPEIVEEAIRKHREGYVVTLMWHAGRPQDDPPYDWKKSIQGELSDAQWKELTTPGTPLNLRWQAQADRVAAHLKRLRDARVPVLWRPYHEMNGVWFWWGDKKGRDGYQKLWKMLYERFVKHHGLNNLLWVWNANAPRDIPKDEAFSYRLYYPGPQYVDALAADVYHFDYEQKDYDELLQLAGGKLVALGEVGELPKAEILEAQPLWSWFMVWSSWLVTDNTPDRVKEIYAHPRTLTHDEVAQPL